MRKTPLVNGEFYHIFNRGVAQVPVFLCKKDYIQATSSLFFYNSSNVPIKFSRYKTLSIEDKESVIKKGSELTRLVKIVCYALMPNHFHLLVQQISDNGISTLLRKFTDSYSKYFNTKYERVGPLFQGVFKSKHIDSENQLVHVSRYIHLNPLTSFVVDEKEFLSYEWSSMKDYLIKKSDVIYSEPVLFHFNSPDEYIKFVMNQTDYQRKLKQIEHLLIEK